jgi:hypothetical protein
MQEIETENRAGSERGIRLVLRLLAILGKLCYGFKRSNFEGHATQQRSCQLRDGPHAAELAKWPLGIPAKQRICSACES